MAERRGLWITPNVNIAGQAPGLFSPVSFRLSRALSFQVLGQEAALRQTDRFVYYRTCPSNSRSVRQTIRLSLLPIS